MNFWKLTLEGIFPSTSPKLKMTTPALTLSSSVQVDPGQELRTLVF